MQTLCSNLLKVKVWFTHSTYEASVDITSYNDELFIANILHGSSFSKDNFVTELYSNLFLFEGDMSFKINGEAVSLHAPVFIDILDMRFIENIEASENLSAQMIFMTTLFFKESVSEVLKNISGRHLYNHFEAPIVHFSASQTETMFHLVQYIKRTIYNKEHYFQRAVLSNSITSLMYELWNIIAHNRWYDSTPAVNNHKWDDISSRFLHLVHKNCKEHHDVNWYAQQLCVSPDRLTAYLKRMTGKSASAHIGEILISVAKIYLRNSEYTIQQIASIMNFADQSSFGKFFKRYYGSSPLTYRKQMMKF